MLPRVILPDSAKCIATSAARPIGIHATDSSTVSVAFADGRLLAVDLNEDEPCHIHQLDIEPPVDLATCSADGSVWAFANAGKVTVFEWRGPRHERPRCLGETTLDSTWLYEFDFTRPALLSVSADGDAIVVDHDSGSASLYRLSGPSRHVLLRESRVIGGAFVGTGREMVLLGDDEVLRLLDEEGSERACFRTESRGCTRGMAFVGFVEHRDAVVIAHEIEEYAAGFEAVSLTTGRSETMGAYTVYALDDRSGCHIVPTPWRDGWVTIDSAGRIDLQQPHTIQVRLPHERLHAAGLVPSGNHVVYVPWRSDDDGPHQVWVAGLHTAMRYARHLERGELAEAGELDVQFAKRREGEQVCGRCGWIRVSIGNGSSCHCDH